MLFRNLLSFLEGLKFIELQYQPTTILGIIETIPMLQTALISTYMKWSAVSTVQIHRDMMIENKNSGVANTNSIIP